MTESDDTAASDGSTFYPDDFLCELFKEISQSTDRRDELRTELDRAAALWIKLYDTPPKKKPSEAKRELESLAQKADALSQGLQSISPSAARLFDVNYEMSNHDFILWSDNREDGTLVFREDIVALLNALGRVGTAHLWRRESS